MLVFLPVKLAMRLIPSIFSLDIVISDPFIQIPADMLLFQICIPFAIEHFKLRTTIQSFHHYWFTAVGWALGLTNFLLPRPDDNGGQENANGEVHYCEEHVVGDAHWSTSYNTFKRVAWVVGNESTFQPNLNSVYQTEHLSMDFTQ